MGVSSSSGFPVTVDTTPPTLICPPIQFYEATSEAGAAVFFNEPTVSDNLSSFPILAYSIPRGATFPLGTTTVDVTAADGAGNETSGAFDVTVRDTTTPILTLPPDQFFIASDPAGVTVDYVPATAVDVGVGLASLTHLPPSGAIFPLGTTTVTATAVDNLGYASSGSFQVHVFDDVPPIDITLSGSSVAETDAAGFAVGEFSTVDPEANNTFVYTLVDGVTYPGNAAFAIEGNQLRTRQWFDYEPESAYQICVRSTDPVGLYAERTFTILVTTVPDVLVLTPPDWTDAGLTLVVSGGMLHAYVSGTMDDAVPPRDAAGLRAVQVVGRDDADDQLVLDFSGGNPIPLAD